MAVFTFRMELFEGSPWTPVAATGSTVSMYLDVSASTGDVAVCVSDDEPDPDETNYIVMNSALPIIRNTEIPVKSIVFVRPLSGDAILMGYRESPPWPSGQFATAIVNIQNTNEPAVTVAAADFPQFTIGSTVRFEGTGNATLNMSSFTVISINTTGKTFKINANLSAAPSSIQQGTIFLVHQG